MVCECIGVEHLQRGCPPLRICRIQDLRATGTRWEISIPCVETAGYSLRMRQKAAIRIVDAEAGLFPSVCVKTGRPATHSKRRTFTSSPDWTWMLLLFGIFPWAVALFASSQSVSVRLPIADKGVGIWAVTGRIDGSWLWLGGVHPAFARELGRMYADLPSDQFPG